jgi:hypothetical protein
MKDAIKNHSLFTSLFNLLHPEEHSSAYRGVEEGKIGTGDDKRKE